MSDNFACVGCYIQRCPFTLLYRKPIHRRYTILLWYYNIYINLVQIINSKIIKSIFCTLYIMLSHHCIFITNKMSTLYSILLSFAAKHDRFLMS